jgi:hypothetical protein
MDINRNNYESFFLLYLDRELNTADKHAVEKFLSENSDLQKEFILLQQTVLTQDDARFEPKELLFREEEKRRILPLYWVRIAAAVMIILTTGWFIVNVISKNHNEKIAGDYRVANAGTLSKKDTLKTNEDKNRITESQQMTTEKPMGKKNSGKTLLEKKIIQDNMARNKRDNLAESSDAYQKNSITAASYETPMAVQKSSTALEIQQDNLEMTNDKKQVSVVAGTTASALVITSAGSKNQLKKDDSDSKEPEYQTDNAISVISLDDRNKSITGFFKKLTGNNPDNNKTTSTRKIHVSVFQFSY